MKQAMALIGPRSTIALFAAVHLLVFSRAAQASDHPRDTGPVGFLVHSNYHGWTNAIVLSNGRVEAVIVPARRQMRRAAVELDDAPKRDAAVGD